MNENMKALVDRLTALPAKAKPSIRGRRSPLSEIVPALVALRDRGWSEVEIAAELAKEGIDVAAGTIRNRINAYLRDAKAKGSSDEETTSSSTVATAPTAAAGTPKGKVGNPAPAPSGNKFAGFAPGHEARFADDDNT